MYLEVLIVPFAIDLSLSTCVYCWAQKAKLKFTQMLIWLHFGHGIVVSGLVC